MITRSVTIWTGWRRRCSASCSVSRLSWGVSWRCCGIIWLRTCIVVRCFWFCTGLAVWVRVTWVVCWYVIFARCLRTARSYCSITRSIIVLSRASRRIVARSWRSAWSTWWRGSRRRRRFRFWCWTRWSLC